MSRSITTGRTSAGTWWRSTSIIRLVIVGDSSDSSDPTARSRQRAARAGTSLRRNPDGLRWARSYLTGAAFACTFQCRDRPRSNSKIADDLVVSETTVKTHFTRVLMKLGMRGPGASRDLRLREWGCVDRSQADGRALTSAPGQSVSRCWPWGAAKGPRVGQTLAAPCPSRRPNRRESPQSSLTVTVPTIPRKSCSPQM
jgi:Bacterial regulatory proteins, luxR family